MFGYIILIGDGVCQHNEDPGYPLTNGNCELAEEVEFVIVHVRPFWEWGVCQPRLFCECWFTWMRESLLLPRYVDAGRDNHIKL